MRQKKDIKNRNFLSSSPGLSPITSDEPSSTPSSVQSATYPKPNVYSQISSPVDKMKISPTGLAYGPKIDDAALMKILNEFPTPNPTSDRTPTQNHSDPYAHQYYFPAPPTVPAQLNWFSTNQQNSPCQTQSQVANSLYHPYHHRDYHVSSYHCHYPAVAGQPVHYGGQQFLNGQFGSGSGSGAGVEPGPNVNHGH